MTQFLTALLDKQTNKIKGPGDSSKRKPWVLGSCADTSSVKKEIKYDNLMDLFEGVVEEGSDYYFTYNMSVWPWEVSLVAKPSGVEDEEFEDVVPLDKADLCYTCQINGTTWNFAFRLSSFGKRLRKAIIGCGYQVNLNSGAKVNLLPLFATVLRLTHI